MKIYKGHYCTNGNITKSKYIVANSLGSAGRILDLAIGDTKWRSIEQVNTENELLLLQNN